MNSLSKDQSADQGDQGQQGVPPNHVLTFLNQIKVWGYLNLVKLTPLLLPPKTHCTACPFHPLAVAFPRSLAGPCRPQHAHIILLHSVGVVQSCSYSMARGSSSSVAHPRVCAGHLTLAAIQPSSQAAAAGAQAAPWERAEEAADRSSAPAALLPST